MKQFLIAIIMFTTVETLEMSDMTITTDSSSSDTSQRVFIVMSNGNSLFDEFEDALKK